MILIKTTAWLSLDQILDLLREGEVKTLRGNDKEEITLHLNYRDTTSGKELEQCWRLANQ